MAGDEQHQPESAAGISSDIGRFAIVPISLLQRCNDRPSGAAALSVFIALHNWADRDRACHPSIASIAEMAGISPASAKRGIAALCEIGALSVQRRYVPGTRELTSSSYRLHHALREPTSAQIRADRSDQIRADGSAHIRAMKKNNLEQEQSEQETEALTLEMIQLPQLIAADPDLSFSAFWLVYPRRVSRSVSERAWQRLSRQDRSAALERLPHQIEAWRRQGTDQAFIPHASTWLNQRRWEDELSSDWKPDPPRRVNPVMAGLERRWSDAQAREASQHLPAMTALSGMSYADADSFEEGSDD